MKRRGFLQRIVSAAIALLAPRWARAQEISSSGMRDLAAAVLPESMGRARTDRAADDFLKWIRDYKSGAEIAAGYGFPRAQSTGANPSVKYAEQLQTLASNGVVTRAAVEKALENAKIDRIPTRPNGKHVAADLLAYFYGSSEGEDFLYGAAIRRDECRGLQNSGRRPEAVK
jgi:hypothetical protein